MSAPYFWSCHSLPLRPGDCLPPEDRQEGITTRRSLRGVRYQEGATGRSTTEEVTSAQSESDHRETASLSGGPLPLELSSSSLEPASLA